MKKLLLNLVLLFIVSMLAIGQEKKDVLKKVSSWSDVLQQAQKEKKLIFVDTYFTGCHPCAQMDEEVFPNAQVSSELANHFVGIKVDVFNEKLGDTINMRYGITGYPSFLILDASGNLLSMFSGFRDAGLLLGELASAKQKAKSGQVLSGFGATYRDAYPEFYKKIWSKEENRKVDPAVANSWIKSQADWKSEPVALPIFRTRNLDKDVEDYLLANYKTYKALYGDALLVTKVSDILSSRLTLAVNKQKNEEVFRKFLSENAKRFPAEDWKIIQFNIAYNYYSNCDKDIMALLQFVNEHPVLYQNYYGAIYSNMTVRKQLSEASLTLLASWAAKTMNAETSFDLLRTAAYVCKNNNDMDGYTKYLNLAIAKANKYGVPAASFEKMLAISREQ